MQTRQWKREKESKIVEAARGVLYHRLLMREQYDRLDHLVMGLKPADLNSLEKISADLDLPTEALTISSSTIREALWPSEKAAPKANDVPANL